jgi:hypothetical protein
MHCHELRACYTESVEAFERANAILFLAADDFITGLVNMHVDLDVEFIGECADSFECCI